MIKEENKNKISEKDYWDNIYISMKKDYLKKALFGYWRKKMILLLDEYLIKDPNKKFIKIGGAPGISAILFTKFFQYDSYVLDYSEEGIKKTKENFKESGISEKKAILGDFLNKNFLFTYQNYFDVILSDGFIEHFNNPRHILKMHLRILKKGGYLIIIPVNNIILKLQPFIKKGVSEQYNAKFMNIEEFKKILSSEKNIEINYLNYLGGINLGTLFYPNIFIRRIIYIIQRFIEIIRLEPLIPLNKYTSPYLICIAKKIS